MTLEQTLLYQTDESMLTVSDLNNQARQLLEQSFPLLWVTGEISNLTRASSGHVYFSLKDEQAQIRCVMFRHRAQLMPFRLAEGMRIEAHVLVTLYEARGEFQLNVEAIRPSGIGMLFEAFSRLRCALEQEGLFAAQRKKALPLYPHGIGIMTSPQGAALHDILITLRRRAPHVPVMIYPVSVQGDNAVTNIVKALDRLNNLGKAENTYACDVLILARGGGSIEDLSVFNNERLARAMYACPIPIITGIGHETDISIADFVADQRAATPTAAAELVSAGYFQVQQRLPQLASLLYKVARHTLARRMQQLDYLAHQLTHPGQRLAHTQLEVNHLKYRLCNAMTNALDTRRHAIHQLRTNLAHLNPKAVLSRGYSITSNAQGHIVHASAGLASGETIRTLFAEGSVESIVS